MAVVLKPLDASALSFVSGPISQFSSLVADTLGNAASEGDGWDDVFGDVLAALAAEDGEGAAMDALLTAASFEAGAFEAAYLAPIATDATAAVEAGQGLIDAIGELGT